MAVTGRAIAGRFEENEARVRGRSLPERCAPNIFPTMDHGVPSLSGAGHQTAKLRVPCRFVDFAPPQSEGLRPTALEREMCR